MSSPVPATDYEAGLRRVPRLRAEGKQAEAVSCADQLCRLRPDDARAHNQAGLSRQDRRKPLEAVRHFRRAVLLQPDAGEVWGNLGKVVRWAAEPYAALRHYRRAAVCLPHLAEARLGLALSFLAVGDYAKGFAEYEHRPGRAKALEQCAAAGIPVWDRRAVRDQRLLLIAEQGAGDVVQFLRFVQPLAERGLAITVACPPAIERLVGSAPGVVAATHRWAPGGPTAYHGVDLLMSVPAILGLDQSSLPVPHRYLEPPAPGKRLPATGRLRVGLCWTGSPAHPANEPRRIPFAALEPVLAVGDADFYSLQIGAGREAIGGESRVVDLAPFVDDFADTAAMIDQMDLVVTIDTSVAHIAGALGKRVWTLLPRVADWRWGHAGRATPWYPSMRLYRQAEIGRWDDVVDAVVGDLRDLVRRWPEEARP